VRVQAFAAQSLLIPLGGFTIVANLGSVCERRTLLRAFANTGTPLAARRFSRVCLGERMSKRDGVATVLILIGIICIAVTGSKDEQSFTLTQVRACERS